MSSSSEFPNWSRGVSARKIAYYSGEPLVIAQFFWGEPNPEIEQGKDVPSLEPNRDVPDK
jgi:hypothetical protein